MTPNSACSRTSPLATLAVWPLMRGVMRRVKFVLLLMSMFSPQAIGEDQLQECPVKGKLVVGLQEMLKKEEYEKIIQRFLPSAKNGDPASQHFVVAMYWNIDMAEAIKWSKLSVDNGCIDGIFLIAHAYREGEGVAKDAEAAFNWYMRAAESGDLTAAGMISAMYQTGEGVEADEDKSIYWLQVSRGEL